MGETVTIQLPLDVARRVRRLAQGSLHPLDRALLEAMPASTAPPEPPLLTGEDLFEMGDVPWVELVKGEMVNVSPTGHLHGRVENNIAFALETFVRQRRLGRVLTGEVGIYTGRNPDTTRAADVAYISNERMRQVKSPSYLDIAPELIVEILSPTDQWGQVVQKLQEYFAIGVQAVWVADPQTQSVQVYRSLTDVQRFTVDDTLPGGAVLPGFSAPVKELFAVD
jgi:Uma2 family endonuclease